MMERADILALFDQEQRQQITYPEARREVLPNSVRIRRDPPGANEVVYSHLDETNADAEIARLVADLAPLGQPYSWRVYGHDTPPDLPQRLERHGFKAEEPGDIMVLDLLEAPAVLLEPPAADLRPLIDRELLVDVIRVLEVVWGHNFGWLQQRWNTHLEVPGYLSVYIVYAGGQPVSTGWTYFPPGSVFASLWGGSTLPAYRRRGYYTALLAARVQEAIRRGRRFLYIDAGPMSRPIVARHGFQFLTSATDYEWAGATG